MVLARQVQPQVVVTDLQMPDGSGLDLVRALRAGSSTIGLVVLTMYAGDEQLFAALEAGASAFVNKDAPVQDVVAATRHALASPTSFTAQDLGPAMQRRLATPATQNKLSNREQQVLQLLADGNNITQLAGRLYISESTAKTHISRIYEKLGAANRSQALMTAVKLGLVSPR